jgi:hypothetical protein
MGVRKANRSEKYFPTLALTSLHRKGQCVAGLDDFAVDHVDFFYKDS